MFALDAISATRMDKWCLPVKEEAKAKAKARAVVARAPGRHGNVKSLDALTHRNYLDTTSYTLRDLRTLALRGRTLQSSLKMELLLFSTKPSTYIQEG